MRECLGKTSIIGYIVDHSLLLLFLVGGPLLCFAKHTNFCSMQPLILCFEVYFESKVLAYLRHAYAGVGLFKHLIYFEARSYFDGSLKQWR